MDDSYGSARPGSAFWRNGVRRRTELTRSSSEQRSSPSDNVFLIQPPEMQPSEVSDEGESDAPLGQEDNDPEGENLDVEGEDDAGVSEEEEEEDEIRSGGEDDEEEPSPPPQPRLKIKLRLPAHAGSVSTNTSTPTPAPEDVLPAKATSRRARSRDLDIESEDEDDEADLSRPSTTRPMTTRQAVLASVVDSSHVSLSEGSRKKKLLNETELALRREETARKRKNLTEKKLEDEKAETINRLLKKQSRPRNKRGAAADDRNTSTNAGMGEPGEDDQAEQDGDGGNGSEPTPPVVPVMYRWISSSRDADTESGKKMTLSFSVPIIALPASSDPHVSSSMDVDIDVQVSTLRGNTETTCAVEGCSDRRKYRLVKNSSVGACGMAHLKLLEAQVK